MKPISLIVSALFVHRESFRTDDLFSLRFSTPKTTFPLDPTPNTSYSPQNSFHSNIISNAFLSNSVVNCFFCISFSLNYLISLLSLFPSFVPLKYPCSFIYLEGISMLKELIQFLVTTENNKGIFVHSFDFSRSNNSILRVSFLFSIYLLNNLQAIL